MTRWICFVLLSWVLVAPAWADGGGERMRSEEAPPETIVLDGASRVLFYPLNDALADAEGALELEIVGDGESLVSEELELPGSLPRFTKSCTNPEPMTEEEMTEDLLQLIEQGQPAVAILAMKPDLLNRVRALQERGVALELRVSFEGQPVETLPFARLDEINVALRQSPLLPRKTESHLTSAALALDPPAVGGLQAIGLGTTTCSQQCESNNLQCEIGCGGLATCLQACSDEYQDCLNDCSTGGCSGPTVRQYTTSQLISRTNTGDWDCLLGLFDHAPFGTRYYRNEELWLHTVYRETTQCDGTVTTQVVDSGYGFSFCWSRGSYACWTSQTTAGYFFCPGTYY